jgi:hypothetical protein
MCLRTPEGRGEMKRVPYRELIGKLLQLALTLPTPSALPCRFEYLHAAQRDLQQVKRTTYMRLVDSHMTTQVFSLHPLTPTL